MAATVGQNCLQQLRLPPQFLIPTISTACVTQAFFAFPPKQGIKSISHPIRSRFNVGQGLPELGASVSAALKRKANTTPLRTGALGTKRGMSAVYDTESGKRSPVTIVQMDRVQVISHKTRRKNGYWAVQVGSGYKDPTNVTRPLLGHFTDHGVSPKRHVVEFKVKDENGLLGIGEMIPASWFQEGQYVDARADSKGKGFAGGMKRHGFKGQPASHGVSLTHRAMGSAGASQGSGSRVLPGKKMPGRMGGNQVTVQNVRVVKVDDERGLVVLSGEISAIHVAARTILIQS